MKIKCNRVALNEAVQAIVSILPLRTPKPILSCVLLQADKEAGLLRLFGTDKEITINWQVAQVEIEQEGSMVLPAARLAGILHESTDENLTLELNDGVCQVTGKDSKYHIYGYDADDFPAVAIDMQGEVWEIQPAVLSRMIRMSGFAAAKEATHYALNGVLWDQQGKKLAMVGTDGRRLAKVSGKLAATGEEDSQNNVLVPVKAMTLMERLLDGDQKIALGMSKDRLVLVCDKVKLQITLLQGRFPKYQDVIPQNLDKKAKIELESFKSAVRRAALLTTDRSKGVMLEFKPGSLRLFSSTPEAGDAEIEMEVSYDGPEETLGFNPFYILDALKVVEEPEITFSFTDSSHPGTIRTGNNFVYVIMPVAV